MAKPTISELLKKLDLAAFVRVPLSKAIEQLCDVAYTQGVIDGRKIERAMWQQSERQSAE